MVPEEEVEDNGVEGEGGDVVQCWGEEEEQFLHVHLDVLHWNYGYGQGLQVWIEKRVDIHACDDVCDQNDDGDVCVAVPELNICIFARSHTAVYKNTRGGSIK